MPEGPRTDPQLLELAGSVSRARFASPPADDARAPGSVVGIQRPRTHSAIHSSICNARVTPSASLARPADG
ncbi:uncharacterized protein TRAVEDRAFT_53373 [Trametes versicolor FP-101664 SS1]|uniref:uncharacterized protein n=1 Tax=Trametes versicolor (strain FP-101664) TaxID=717944 RepID=UPI000462147C|nr:uncharacterized protein TRAVEDRAFT_53373 [Trametes versicolor FP-101664 SS1]EIW52945.1 hypothetical protein TRAVEDRAFT_53373 [Trametes versicolor FP-101664 SS1]